MRQFSMAVMAFRILVFPAVSSTKGGRSIAKALTAVLIDSDAFSSSAPVCSLAVCFNLVRFILSWRRNFRSTIVGHRFCFAGIVWISPSDCCLSRIRASFAGFLAAALFQSARSIERIYCIFLCSVFQFFESPALLTRAIFLYSLIILSFPDYSFPL